MLNSFKLKPPVPRDYAPKGKVSHLMRDSHGNICNISRRNPAEEKQMDFLRSRQSVTV